MKAARNEGVVTTESEEDDDNDQSELVGLEGWDDGVSESVGWEAHSDL